MPTRIYTDNNFVIIEDNDGNVINEAPKSKVSYRQKDGIITVFAENYPRRFEYGEAAADWLDTDGNAISGGVVAWLRENVGFSTASGGSGAVSNNVEIQTEITTNTTINGTRKGLNNVYPINSDSDVKITVDKGTYAVGDVVNFKWLGSGLHTIERGANVRLEGKRAIDNIHRRANIGNFASVIFDRLDGTTLVGAVIGDVQDGYVGAIEVTNTPSAQEGATAIDLVFIGTGFSENTLITVNDKATINSITYNSTTSMTVNIDVDGLEDEDIVFTFDNGDISAYTITIQQAAGVGEPDLVDYVAYWKWEDNMNDEINSNDGTLTAVTFNASGNVGKSAIFAGSDNYAIVPHNNALSFGDSITDNPFTIVDTVKFEDTDDQWLISKDSSGGKEYRTTYQSGELSFFLFDESTGGSLRTHYTFTPVLGQWYHIMYIYDGSSQPKIFLNNTEVGTENNSGTYVAMENDGADIIFGAQEIGGYSRSHDGERDETAIFNIAFTEDNRDWAYNKFLNQEALR